MKKYINIKNVVLCLVALWMLLITLFTVTNTLDNAHIKKQLENHRAWLTYFGVNVNGDEQIPAPKEVR